MASEVYFASMRCNSRESSLLNKVNRLFKRAGFEEIIDKNDLVAIKLHFGEMGNTGFIRPIYLKQIVDQVKKRKGKLTLGYFGHVLINFGQCLRHLR